MAKQPKLVLRESCVQDLTRTWNPGRFAEMGAGTGHMSQLFLDRGFHGVCHDLGVDSREMARSRFSTLKDRMQVVDDLAQLAPESFQYLFAFEVLEHIDEDANALSGWSRLLAKGGRLLVSVPAHQRKFGRSDELVGHVRRYERQQLHDLLDGAGFGEIRMVNYGFPVTELTRRLSNRLVRSDHSYDALSAEERSIRSAQKKPEVINRWLRIFSGNLVLPFCWAQRVFYHFDWGDGLVACATKLRAI